MSGDSTMGITRAAKPFEWNLNTLNQIGTLITMIVGGVALWVDKSRDIDELERWRQGHEQYHKERLAEVKATEARSEVRFRGLESAVRKIDNLEYRVTVTEQSTASIAATLKEVQTLLSDQSGDIKVVREILQRIEASQRSASSSP